MSQLPWTEAQWARVQAAVTEEFTKSSVAGAALPCYGPLESGMEAVSVQALLDNRSNDEDKKLPIRVNDDDSTRLCTLSVLLEFSGQQVSDANLGSVMFAVRRAANMLARKEDEIVLNGHEGAGRVLRLAGKVVGVARRAPAVGLDNVRVSEDFAKRGLISALDGIDRIPADIKDDSGGNREAIEVRPNYEGQLLGCQTTPVLRGVLQSVYSALEPQAPLNQTLLDVKNSGELKTIQTVAKLGLSSLEEWLKSIDEGGAEIWSGMRDDTADDWKRDFLAVLNTAKAQKDQARKHVDALLLASNPRAAKKPVDDSIQALALCASLIRQLVMTAMTTVPAVSGRPSNSGTPVYGEKLVAAITKSLSVLNERGYAGPYACVMGSDVFNEAHRPSRDSLVLPADRINPMLGGALVRSGAMEPRYAAVVASSGDAIDIVVATPPKAQFLQMTSDGKYLFRVYERFTLRIKDPKAIVPLVLVDL